MYRSTHLNRFVDIYFLLKSAVFICLFFALSGISYQASVYASGDQVLLQLLVLFVWAGVCFLGYFFFEEIKHTVHPVFLISVLDVVFVFLFFQNSPFFLWALFSIFGFSVFFGGFFSDVSKNIFLISLSIFFASLYFILNPVEWKSFYFLSYVLNIASLFGYGFLAYTGQRFVFSSLTQVKKIQNLNQIILNSIKEPVLVYNKKRNLILQNQSAKNQNVKKFPVSKFLKEKQIYLNKKIFSVSVAELSFGKLESEGHVVLLSDETEKIKKQKELEQAQRLSAIGTLSAGLAHEIRNPLAGMSGSAELLLDSGVQGDRALVQKLVKTILSEITRLNGLLTDFLDFAKPEQYKKTLVDAQVLLSEVANLARRNPLSANLEFEFYAEPCKVILDPEKIKQVVLNFVLNAFQAFDEKDNKGFSTVKLLGYQSSGYYWIKVEDNGCGIEKDHLNKIFEPFHTTKDKGTGLGLAISHRILKEHGFAVFVESQIGEGTEFAVGCPLENKL